VASGFKRLGDLVRLSRLRDLARIQRDEALTPPLCSALAAPSYLAKPTLFDMAAFPHPMGLLPSEVAFLCEMEQITIIPRQRLERLDLLGVSLSHDLRKA
jgi:hypothetical protein